MNNIENNIVDKYDVLIVGAGHAGVEAAVIASKLGVRTAIFTLSLDNVSLMPCNPSIGGTAKGQLVREIDALGGVMGNIADLCTIQFRMLNISKGAAVHSPRAQVDRKLYQNTMKNMLEKQQNLDLIESEVIKILVEHKKVVGLLTAGNTFYKAKAIIIATGTFLNSKIIVGKHELSSGPNGNISSFKLKENLINLGINLKRFKTGTPPRVNKRSINFDVLELQNVSDDLFSFSIYGEKKNRNVENCYIAYTNALTHEIILNNLKDCPAYSGTIKGIGPRYCPSIENKVVRFSDKTRHQLFVEPTGIDSNEMYIQGLSTSLSENVQRQILKSIKGFENCEIMRYGYAIEYDCHDPTKLNSTLEFKDINGLYSAGQFNGTSGYEEAAAQGIVAGINSARKILGKSEFILSRAESYIGVLIDDLVTKGTNEPYRMMTSRAEYRLYIRQDNTDERLTKKAYNFGLIKKNLYEKFLTKQERIENEIEHLKKIFVNKEMSFLFKIPEENYGNSTLYDILKRPEISYENFYLIDGFLPLTKLNTEEQNAITIKVKYEGYVNKQLKQIEKFKKLENKKIPFNFSFKDVEGLRLEAKEKLEKIRPRSLGEASRVSGVSPSDILVLMIKLKKMNLDS